MDPLTIALLFGLGGGAFLLSRSKSKNTADPETSSSGSSGSGSTGSSGSGSTGSPGLRQGGFVGSKSGRTLRGIVGDDYDKIPAEVRARLEKELDDVRAAALEECIEQTGDAESCALLLDGLEGDADALRELGRKLAGDGARAACEAHPKTKALAPLCEKLGQILFEKGWKWVRGRQYRRPLYRFGMVRLIRGGASALRPGEYLMPRSAIKVYPGKIRVGALRFENGASFDRARPRTEALAVVSELRAIDHTTATGEIAEVERTLYIPSSSCYAVPVSMGTTLMRDLDGQIRRTLKVPAGQTGFDVSPIKRVDKGLASFPGWVDLEQ